MTQHSGSHLGVTLIETLVALSLVVGLILMAAPMIHVLSGFSSQDGELQAVAAFDESLQGRTMKATAVTASGQNLLLEEGGEAYRLELYRKNTASAPMLRLTENKKGGHMAMLIGVAAVEWQQQDDYVQYSLTMVSGRRYEGVVVTP